VEKTGGEWNYATCPGPNVEYSSAGNEVGPPCPLHRTPKPGRITAPKEKVKKNESPKANDCAKLVPQKREERRHEGGGLGVGQCCGEKTARRLGFKSPGKGKEP